MLVWILVGTAEGLASDGPDYTNIPVPVNITYSSRVNDILSTSVLQVALHTPMGQPLEMFMLQLQDLTLYKVTVVRFSIVHSHRGYFNGLIRYEATQAIDVAWFDAATGGAVIGNGSPFESVGTGILT